MAAVSTNFFHMMGGSIIAGRDFQESDGVLSHSRPAGATGGRCRTRITSAADDDNSDNEYFQNVLAAIESVIGKPLPVSAAFGPPPIIVGVLAPGFELLFPHK